MWSMVLADLRERTILAVLDVLDELAARLMASLGSRPPEDNVPPEQPSVLIADIAVSTHTASLSATEWDAFMALYGTGFQSADAEG
jgi:hypothetical protein